MNKILFITSNFPKNLDNGGKLRDYHILKYLSQRHELWVAGFSERGLKREDVYLPFVPKERCFCIGETQEMPLKKMWHLRNLPMWCLIYYAQEMQEMVDALLNKYSFDYVHVSHSFMAHYVAQLKGIPRVVDHHNVKTIFYQDALVKTHNPLNKINFQAEYYKWFNYERDVLSQFEFHTSCSKKEQSAIKEFTNSSVELLPSGVDVNKFYPRISKSLGLNLLFTGSLDYFPNADAAVYFCQSILPRIRKEIPNVIFQVVGRKPSAALEKTMRSTPNTWFSCDVKDMRPFYYQSTLFVVPLLDGAGTRLKIMEAMATGLPVVTTSKGCEGLDVNDGEGVLVADNPHDFARTTVRLLKDDELREALRHQALKVCRERFSWDKTLNSLENIYK